MTVRVDEVSDDVDLRATILQVSTHATPPRPMRALPLISIGAYGR
jgi:hypothetical protein